MPAFNLKCNSCFKELRKILKDYVPVKCDCGGIMSRQANVSSQIKEIIDNGIMTRKVERLADINELRKNRNKDDDGSLI